MSQESIASKTARCSFWTAIEKFSTMGVGFVVSMVLARLLSPSDFGTVALLGVFFAIATSLSNGGFSNALIRKTTCSQADYSTAFFYNAAVSIGLYLLLFFAAPLIADFYDKEILCSVMRVSGLTLIINALKQTQLVQLTRELKYKDFAYVALSASLISGIVGVTCAFLGFGIWALVIKGLVGSITNMLVLFLICRWIPTFEISRDSFKYLWGFGSKMLITGLISSLYSNIYSIVVGKAYNTSVLGLFNRGQSLAILCPNIVDGVFTKTVFPILSQIKDDHNHLMAVYRKMVVTVSALNIPLCLLMCALAKPFVLFFLTDKWIGAVPYIQIFSLSMITSSAGVINLCLFQVEGRPDFMLKVEIIKKSIGFVLVFVLLAFGPLVLAIGNSLFLFYAYGVDLYYVNKMEQLPYFQQLRDLMPCTIAAVIASLVAWGITCLSILPIIQLILGGIIGLAAYYVITRYIIKMDIYDQIFAMIKSKKRCQREFLM